ncbi:hypothetical protein [Ornithinimicrobium kibberense]|uniref:hypothetical protein n=1 Tax=Ornithinimicrobium kibberense TaxID=282060 RepID=UPI0036143445
MGADDGERVVLVHGEGSSWDGDGVGASVRSRAHRVSDASPPRVTNLGQTLVRVAIPLGVWGTLCSTTALARSDATCAGRPRSQARDT